MYILPKLTSFIGKLVFDSRDNVINSDIYSVITVQHYLPGLFCQNLQNLDEKTKEDYLGKELWIKENFNKWKAERDTEMKIKMAQSGRYKSYRRYMKANGPGRMYFDDS